MPKLFVPHVRQIEDGYCLPACVEMVLVFYGIHRPQAQIAKQLDIIEGAGHTRVAYIASGIAATASCSTARRSERFDRLT